ncbi:S-layer homology domain-containing protein [Aneurinibacillus tyrosinisolvens]|uniref:S-layer homology domain-containing protein n=1 Tax=Aneurinibacillus tyrosinisolvens TaxID=1443435 RepID=UPI00063F36D4|nr:S-layer homology domain-containing protein [Aneurinibacillus tyrosinisolvens]
MKFMKGLLVLLLCLSMSTPAWAADDTEEGSYSTQPIDFYYPEDIDGHWAAEALDDLISADIVKGYDQGEGTVQLKPNNAITRAEFVSLLVRALDLKPTGQSKTFIDVKKGQWFYNDVTTATSLGIVGGINANQFAPTAKIKRDEIAALMESVCCPQHKRRTERI